MLLRFRVTSVGASFILWSAAAFLAANHRITGGSFDPIDLLPPLTIAEEPPKPPPPPPPRTNEPRKIVDTSITPTDQSGKPTEIPVGEPQQAATEPMQITGATWLKRPGAREFDKWYPARAVEREKEGRVVLRCAVGVNGAINCSVASETPEGWGFGAAAVQISKSFQMAPQTVDGEPTSGGIVSVPITFALGG